MSKVAAAVFALMNSIATAGLASAQPVPGTPTTPGFELLVPSGTVVPTGAQGDAVTQGNMTAVQASFGLRPDLVMTSTVGWTRSTPRGLGPDARLHVYTYDAGLEYRLPRRTSDRRVAFKPFAGAGVGGRTHDYRHIAVATRHDVSAYASAGAELGLWRVRLRLEARNYLTWGTPLGATRGTSRNDVAVLAGLRLALR